MRKNEIDKDIQISWNRIIFSRLGWPTFGPIEFEIVAILVGIIVEKIIKDILMIYTEYATKSFSLDNITSVITAFSRSPTL